MHRLTAVDYDYGGGVTREAFAYDHLGNRVTYWDNRNAVTTAYANNVANEYTSIGGTAVYYDPAGNLTHDELDYKYWYDHENRLTRVTTSYVPPGWSGGPYPVAKFAYDALGRMVSSFARFDGDTNRESQNLKYYYDGPNAIAEYDTSNHLSRRYVHGTSYVDERAVPLEGEGENLDSYYYVLQELCTVAGVMKKNGVLAEAYVYDGYGKVHPWVFPPAADYDRSGNYTDDDFNVLTTSLSQGGEPTTNPLGDVNCDGDSDFHDMLDVLNIWEDWYETDPVSLRVSGVGNAFFFTGRRLHFLEQTALTGLNPNHQVQDNRRRHYLPGQGRWLQRDPAEYVDGMNLYQYVRSRPTRLTDPKGKCPNVFPGEIVWSPATLNCGKKYFSRWDPELSVEMSYSVSVPKKVFDKACCAKIGLVQIARERYDKGQFGAWVLDGSPWYPKTTPASPTTNTSLAVRDQPGWDPYGSMSDNEFRQEFETCVVCVTRANKITCLLSCFTWSYDYTLNLTPPPDHSLELTISGHTITGLPAEGNPDNTPFLQHRPIGSYPAHVSDWNRLLGPCRFR
ncbi:MAG TPA: RHS repeat-associated core domain-containing protein [Phycisphaerae bacterium]|nr:RHS repeat-associated core domain-containing protein [Phycisphaerae bacterium]